ATHNPLESRWKCFHKGFTGDQRSSQKNCIKGENLKAFEKVRDFFGMTCNTRRTSHERSLYSRNCSRRLRWSGTRRDYYFNTKNAARKFRLRIKRRKAEQKSPADALSFDDSDKRWLAYLRAHVGNLELLPAIVTHWERTAKPITRPLKVEELCKDFVLYRQSKGLDKATLSEDRYI